MKHRLLMVGAGGMASNWIRHFLPNFRDRLEIVGLVDINQAVLDTAGELVGVPPTARFTHIADAFATIEADCCSIVIPPAFHREAVLAAVSRGMHILSEKPIADTWEACVDIYRAVTKANIKMQIIQNYRYEPPNLAFREVLNSCQLGQLNYIVCRFLSDYRQPLSWGGKAFRHEIPHALLVEGAIHHFDMVRYFTGSDCRYLFGWEWNPNWSSSKGEFNNMFLMEMTNGVRVSYEGSGTAAGVQNTWDHEYYRAECENGSVILDGDEQVRIFQWTFDEKLEIKEIPLPELSQTGHIHLIAEFLDWLDGALAPATQLADNIKSAAMVFGAIKASRINSVVDIEAMVNAAMVI